MFLTDGGLPVNGTMLVGGVSQLAQTPWPLCASPNDFSSHSFFLLSSQPAHLQREKAMLYILSDQADKYALFLSGYRFSASHSNLAFKTI